MAPKESGAADYLGAFVVTAGLGADEAARARERANDDYGAIMVKALADRLAEAFAERLHERVRKEFWGYAKEEGLDNEAFIKERYRGIRPAPGYPACPDHTEKQTLLDLIDPQGRAGVSLTESFAMLPAASVSGWYFAPSRGALFRRGQNRARSGARLRPQEGHGARLHREMARFLPELRGLPPDARRGGEGGGERDAPRTPLPLKPRFSLPRRSRVRTGRLVPSRR